MQATLDKNKSLGEAVVGHLMKCPCGETVKFLKLAAACAGVSYTDAEFNEVLSDLVATGAVTVRSHKHTGTARRGGLGKAVRNNVYTLAK